MSAFLRADARFVRVVEKMEPGRCLACALRRDQKRNQADDRSYTRALKQTKHSPRRSRDKTGFYDDGIILLIPTRKPTFATLSAHSGLLWQHPEMSALGGKADVKSGCCQCPLMTHNGHLTRKMAVKKSYLWVPSPTFARC